MKPKTASTEETEPRSQPCPCKKIGVRRWCCPCSLLLGVQRCHLRGGGRTTWKLSDDYGQRGDEVEGKAGSVARRWPTAGVEEVARAAARGSTPYTARRWEIPRLLLLDSASSTPDLWAAPPNQCEEWWKGGAS
jgi:hypothetical protein